MKRDMDLVRAILLVIENNEKEYLGQVDVNSALSEQFPEPKWTGEQRIAHIKMMKEAGLVEVDIINTMRNATFTRLRMKWEGQEFIENARDDGIWKKAKEKFGDVSFAVLKQGLVELVRQSVL